MRRSRNCVCVEEDRKTKPPNEREETSTRFSGILKKRKKAKEQHSESKDMMTCQAALEKFGMPVEQQDFCFKDHKVLYNYAHEQAPFTQPPIKMIDASVAPLELNLYPEYPLSEFWSPPAFINTSVLVLKTAFKSKREAALNSESTPLQFGILHVLAGPKRFFISSQLNGA